MAGVVVTLSIFFTPGEHTVLTRPTCAGAPPPAPSASSPDKMPSCRTA